METKSSKAYLWIQRVPRDIRRKRLGGSNIVRKKLGDQGKAADEDDLSK